MDAGLEARSQFQAGNPSGVHLRVFSNTTNFALEVGPEEAARFYDGAHPDVVDYSLMSKRYAKKVWPSPVILSNSLVAARI